MTAPSISPHRNAQHPSFRCALCGDVHALRWSGGGARAVWVAVAGDVVPDGAVLWAVGAGRERGGAGGV